MDQNNTGALIRSLRTESRMTQRALAQALGVTDQAVSKWERGLGCPDTALLPGLAQILGVTVEQLLSGTPEPGDPNGGNMRKLNFYICPQCGNLLTATGKATLSCCGRTLEPLSPQKPDEAHKLTIEPVEDEWFLTAAHPMEKEHYISFAALVNGEQLTLLKRWPEWDFQARLPRRGHGLLYWHCSQHGLFRQNI